MKVWFQNRRMKWKRARGISQGKGGQKKSSGSYVGPNGEFQDGRMKSTDPNMYDMDDDEDDDDEFDDDEYDDDDYNDDQAENNINKANPNDYKDLKIDDCK